MWLDPQSTWCETRVTTGKVGSGGLWDKGRVDAKGSAYIERAALDRNVAVSPLVSSDCAQSLWRAVIILDPPFSCFTLQPASQGSHWMSAASPSMGLLLSARSASCVWSSAL